MNGTTYSGAPGPGATTTQSFNEVLASLDLQAKLPGGVLLAQGHGVVAKGTVLGKVTATGKFIPYLTGAVDGSQTAVCILDNDTDTATADAAASAWISGVFLTTALTGLDSGAKTALKLCYFA